MKSITLKCCAAAMLVCALLPEANAQTQKTIVFGSVKTTKSKKYGHKQEEDYGRNTITVSLLSYLDGYTAVSYERMINEFFTISAGAGVTYKNLWMQMGDQIASIGSYNSLVNRPGDIQDIEDEYGDFQYRKARLGTYFSLSPKFYPRNESLDGSYVAPLFEYRDYRFGAQRAMETPVANSDFDGSANSVPRSNEWMTETVRCLDFSAVWGGHYQLRDHLVLDYHVGLGVRNVKASRQDLGYEVTSSNALHFTNEVNNYSTNRFLANIGFAIGGWW
jgi:hypothetical protein